MKHFRMIILLAVVLILSFQGLSNAQINAAFCLLRRIRG